MVNLYGKVQHSAIQPLSDKLKKLPSSGRKIFHQAAIFNHVTSSFPSSTNHVRQSALGVWQG